jgi:hypothetical protein
MKRISKFVISSIGHVIITTILKFVILNQKKKFIDDRTGTYPP